MVVSPMAILRCWPSARSDHVLRASTFNVALKSSKFMSSHLMINKRCREGLRKAIVRDGCRLIGGHYRLDIGLARNSSVSRYGRYRASASATACLVVLLFVRSQSAVIGITAATYGVAGLQVVHPALPLGVLRSLGWSFDAFGGRAHSSDRYISPLPGRGGVVS